MVCLLKKLLIATLLWQASIAKECKDIVASTYDDFKDEKRMLRRFNVMNGGVKQSSAIPSKFELISLAVLDGIGRLYAIGTFNSGPIELIIGHQRTGKIRRTNLTIPDGKALTVDKNNNLYVADGNDSIWIVDSGFDDDTDQQQKRIASKKLLGRTGLSDILGLAFDNERKLFATDNNGQLHTIDYGSNSDPLPTKFVGEIMGVPAGFRIGEIMFSDRDKLYGIPFDNFGAPIRAAPIYELKREKKKRVQARVFEKIRLHMPIGIDFLCKD